MPETTTLREQLEGFRAFNVWERAAQQTDLPGLSVADSLAQFFELCTVAARLALESDAVSLAENSAHWQTMHNRQRQLAEWGKNGTTTRRVA